MARPEDEASGTTQGAAHEASAAPPPQVFWRLAKARYVEPYRRAGADLRAARGPLSGYGSLLRGGRWHPKGYPVVYAAESAALALLETLVHVERADLIRFDCVVIPVRLPASPQEVLAQGDLIEVLDEQQLPPDWKAWPSPPSTQRIGAAWLEAKRSAALVVPSVVVPHERNVLLSPAHPRFGDLLIGEPQPFPLDERLAL
jgi:RES domain-containing protein